MSWAQIIGTDIRSVVERICTSTGRQEERCRDAEPQPGLMEAPRPAPRLNLLLRCIRAQVDVARIKNRLDPNFDARWNAEYRF